MKTRKKILSFLLVLTLIMTSLPAQLFATEVVNIPINLQTDLFDSQRTTPAIIDINPNIFVGDGYQVDFKVSSQWPGAFNGEIILTNTGEKALENWTLGFDFEHEISNIWNAQIVAHEGTSYLVKNLEWNQDIAPGSSVSIGFGASWSDYINPPKGYSLLGTEQEVGEADYTIAFKVVSDWGQAFNAEISITNNTKEAIEDWTLEFDFDRNVDRFWTAEIVKREGNHYIIKNLGYNANIASGQTLTLGFAGNPGNVDNEPSGYKLNQIGQEIDKWDIDTDKDGLPDFLEKLIGTNPKKADTDEDGLSDRYEYLVLETDPLKIDTNDNGISDADEDPDEDSLTNIQEYELGTDPFNADTDGDGLKDNEEVNIYNTDPNKYDTDGDTLSDGDEISLGLNPLHTHTYNGILDSNYFIRQQLSEENLSNINTADNIYSLTLDITAAGNVKNHLVAEESSITSALSDNRAIIGTVCSLNYDENKIESATLKFTLNKEYIDSKTSIFPKEEVFQTVERYQVFRFDRGLNLLYPIETIHDISNNTISANVTQLGDYCIIDMEQWLFDIGVIDTQKETLSGEKRLIMARSEEVLLENELQTNNQSEKYEDISLEELQKIMEVDMVDNKFLRTETMQSVMKNTINKQADLVFVIDTTGSMGSAIANVKANIASVLQYLRSKNITLHVSFIDYQDITFDGINSTTVHELNGSNWIYNSTDMLKVLNGISLGNGGDWEETPIDGLGFAEQLKYRSGAYKFVVLITDASYKVNNTHGIASLEEVATKLNAKGIHTCVVGAYSYYKNLYTMTNGIGIGINNFSVKLQEYIDQTMSEDLGEVYLDSIDLTTGVLAKKLEKDSLTDTDEDGIPDCEEVDWNYIEVVDGKANVATLGELLKTLKDTNLEVFNRFIYLLRKLETSEIMSVKTLTTAVGTNPIMDIKTVTANKSSAFKSDTDQDGYIDIDDPNPIFIKENPAIWDGTEYGIKNTIYNSFFEKKLGIGDFFIFQNPNQIDDFQTFDFTWTGKGYIISKKGDPNKVFTCTRDAHGNDRITIENKSSTANQLWLVIPNKDGNTYKLKCLMPLYLYGGIYVNTKDKGYVILDSDIMNSKIALVTKDMNKKWLTFEDALLRIEKGNATKEIKLAYNKYIDNKKELDNFKGFANGKDPINGQGLLPWPKIKLGNDCLDYNGCGPMATYNSLFLKGEDANILKITFEFELNALLARGVFGTKPWKISDYFYNHSVNYSLPESIEELDANLRTGKVGILVAWNGWFWEGAHYVAIKHNPSNNKISVYNLYGNVAIVNEDYSSVQDLINANFGDVIQLYAL